MARVRLFHWKAAEANPLIEALRASGHTVDYSGDKMFTRLSEYRKNLPEAFVIDLTRMPSHGRVVASSLRATKYTRHLPIVFVDGDPEKVATLRKVLPDAVYTTRSKAGAAVKKAKPVAEPVVLPTGIESHRPLAQKLGIRENTGVALFEAPPGYARMLGDLPSGAWLEEEPREALTITLWFVRDPGTYLAGLPRMRELAAKTRLWVVYPKQKAQAASPALSSAGSITQFMVRDAAIKIGLVDYKICSVNETWTGMLFARKKS
jgi:hypothetical protein